MDKTSLELLQELNKKTKTTLFGEGKEFHELSNYWSEILLACYKEKIAQDELTIYKDCDG